MRFGFASDWSDIGLWDIDLLDTDLDLLDTDIPSKHFVCLQDVLKINKCLLKWDGETLNFYRYGVSCRNGGRYFTIASRRLHKMPIGFLSWVI